MMMKDTELVEFTKSVAGGLGRESGAAGAAGDGEERGRGLQRLPGVCVCVLRERGEGGGAERGRVQVGLCVL